MGGATHATTEDFRLTSEEHTGDSRLTDELQDNSGGSWESLDHVTQSCGDTEGVGSSAHVGGELLTPLGDELLTPLGDRLNFTDFKDILSSSDHET